MEDGARQPRRVRIRISLPDIFHVYAYQAEHICILCTLPAKSMEYFEAQWKHSDLTFLFDGNSMAPTTTKYCHFNAFLMHSARSEKYNLQCPKLKLYKMIYGDLSFFKYFA